MRKKHGADPNARDKSGSTVLHHAVSNKVINITKDLLVFGADPNAKLIASSSEYTLSRDGFTPFMVATESNNLEAFDALLEVGVNPFLANHQNTTALLLAAGANVNPANFIPDSEVVNATQIAKRLVEMGADVNARGPFGWTAMHAAAYHGRNDIIELLINHGANIEVMDNFGQTPLSISYAIVTEGVGDNYNQTPRTFRRDTADILLTHGALPLEVSGVKVLSQRASR
jgi:ankyrin repeat protein